MTPRPLIVALVLAIPVAGRAQDQRPPILREIGFDQRLGESLPLEVTLRDESGHLVRLGDHFGRRPVILSLVYYGCPMLCTVTMNGLTTALGVLSFSVGKEFEVVTLSFDPKETPELAASKKKTHLERYRRAGAASGWHFLTGDAAAIERITKAVGFRYAWDAETKQFAHPAGVMVVTPEGRIARYLYGVEYAPKDLRLALVEASAGRIGSPLDQIILSCYRYDPTTGKYGAVIMRIVRLGGVLTVLALGTFLIVMFRREHARPRAMHGGAR